MLEDSTEDFEMAANKTEILDTAIQVIMFLDVLIFTILVLTCFGYIAVAYP